MRFLRRSLAGLMLLALTAALLAWAVMLVRDAVEARLASEPPTPPARERVFAVNVIEARAGQEVPVIATFGEVESRRQLEVRAAAGGEIVYLPENFVEGGAVAAGEVLARIDPTDAELAVRRAQTDVADAEAETREAERGLSLARDEEAAAEEQLALREAALKRQRDLAARGVGTAAAVESAELAVAAARQALLSRRQAVATAEARVDQARTRLERARIALEEARRRLADHEIRAEFAGRLSDVSAVVGGRVSAGERLARLVDPKTLEVAFRLSTAQHARLLDEEGRLRPVDVRVALDVFGARIEATGRIVREKAEVGEGRTGRVIYARLDEAGGFRPGDFVTVEVREPPLDDVVRLPASALGNDGAVLVVGEGERLERAEVTLLRRQGDDVLVRASAIVGRLVVRERTPVLGPGIRVRPVVPAEAGAQPAPTGPELVELDPERRARLVAFVEANTRMPADVKARILEQLKSPKVPARVVARLESRMGG